MLSEPTYYGTINGSWSCSGDTLTLNASNGARQDYTLDLNKGSFSIQFSDGCEATLTPNN